RGVSLFVSRAVREGAGSSLSTTASSVELAVVALIIRFFFDLSSVVLPFPSLSVTACLSRILYIRSCLLSFFVLGILSCSAISRNTGTSMLFNCRMSYIKKLESLPLVQRNQDWSVLK